MKGKMAKRLLSGFLVLAMTVSLCTTALAAETAGDEPKPAAQETTETVDETTSTKEPGLKQSAPAKETGSEEAKDKDASKSEDISEKDASSETGKASKAEDTSKTEDTSKAEEVSKDSQDAEKDAVQAFLDAVDAIVIPEEINDETGPVLNEQIGAAADAYEALTEEELQREEVQEAAAALKEAMDALTGGAEPLSVQRRYVTLRPTTASGGTFGAVKVKVGDIVKSYNGRQSYTVRSVSGSEITVWVYLDNLGSFYFPKASDLWENVSPVDYVYWSGNNSGQMTENGSGMVSNGSANSGCGLATYYFKSGGSSAGYLWNFELKFDANGGQGAPDALTYGTNGKYDKSHTFTIPTSTPNREGYTFLGWADTANATAAKYQPGNSCLVSQTVSGYNGGSVSKTLYAVWQKNEQKPSKPDENTVKGLLSNAVKIDCTNDSASHADKIYGLLDGTYSIGSVVGNSTSGYTCAVTITNPAPYVEKYNQDVMEGHKLSPENQGNKKITLEYKNNGWTVKEGTAPVTYTVKCTYTLTVIKVFKGITSEQIPDGFALNYTVTPTNSSEPALSGTLEKASGTSGVDEEGNPTLSWEISGLPFHGNGTYISNKCEFTEVNAAVTGYTLKAENLTFTLGDALSSAKRTITNTYTPVTPPDPVKPDWEELEVTKTADKVEAKPGETITYTITVANNTGKDLTNITVSEALDKNLTFIEAKGDGNYANGVWTIASLEKGKTAVLQIKATVNAGLEDQTVISNKVEITGAEDNDGEELPDGTKPSASADVTVNNPTPADPDELKVTKTADKLIANPGDTVNYTITVTNTTGKALTNLKIVDVLPEGLKVVGNMEISGTGFDSFQSSSEGILFPSFRANDNVTIRYSAIVEQNAAGTLTNTVTAETEDKSAAGNASVTITVQNEPTPVKPDWEKLKVTKTADKTTAKPGEIITYTITVANNTGRELTNITVSEALDKNLAFVEVTGDGRYADDVWTIASLENGKTAILTLKAAVKDGVEDKTVISNTAVITGAAASDEEKMPEDTKPSANTGVTVNNPTPAKPDWEKLTVKKTADKTTAKPGETITYTITVANNTGRDLTNITVSEALDKNLTLVSSETYNGGYKDGLWIIDSLENGKTAVLTLKVTINSSAADGTTIKNTAVITGAAADVEEKLPEDRKPSGNADIVVSNSQGTSGSSGSSTSGGSGSSSSGSSGSSSPAKANTSGAPKTGDNSNISLWIALLVLASGSMAGIILYTKKRKMN